MSSFLNFFKGLMEKKSPSEQYLNQASDVSDLENRMRTLGRLPSSLLFSGRC